MNFPFQPPQARQQPIFNLPRVVSGLIAALLAIHFIRSFALDPETDQRVILAFAFFPARISDPAMFAGLAPGGNAAAVSSFLSYALLHADWGHVIINSIWLAAFGAPVAWRFGTGRFLLFSATGAVCGAALFLVTNFGDVTPMIGASAAVSAMMAGASRFALFSGPLIGGGPAVYRRPAQPLATVLRDTRVLAFIGIWFAINLVFGLTGGGIASGAIAWQAHIGGFVAGLLLFPWFDPIPADPGAA
jgi:membrane associated rhomboid family serine protease